MRLYWEDRLVRRFRDLKGNIRFHGKRVGRNCILDYTARRLYVQYGAIKAVAYLKNELGYSTIESFLMLKEARGVIRHR